jgi:hypothetical protein
LGESDGLGMNLAMAVQLDPTNSMTTLPGVLLGTLAKACLRPGNSMMQEMMGMPMGELRGLQPCRPRKILFATQGAVDMLEEDLQAIGIRLFGVAEPNLIRSLERYQSAMQDAQRDGEGMDDSILFQSNNRQRVGEILQTQNRAHFDPYVDEQVISLGSWKPPKGPGEFPKRWYARPPPNRDSYRATQLCGWRTNLEKAVLREDATKVQQIVSERRKSDIREYCECRILLTKCAKRGLLIGCQLLLDKCGVSVEGIQAPDTERFWREIANHSGNEADLTPLHGACREGQAEAVKLLLDKGAQINRLDNSRLRGSALHHSVAAGQTGVCRILCERGADLTYVDGMGNEALDISEMLSGQDVYRERVHKKIQQILREFDRRCAECRTPNASKRCPCHKENYCSPACQKRRWKHHKAYHKQIMGE